MDRRQYLTTIASAGLVSTAGCTTAGESKTLSEPTVYTDAPERQSIEWSVDGDSVGEFGASGSVSNGIVDLSTELSHREGTEVTSIELRVWMPEATGTPAEVAVVSPVEGDSSPPPSLSLYTPQRARGTVIEVTDLDDLADETISTLDFLVKPLSESATTLRIAATIELTDSGTLGNDYTLEGELELTFPALAGE